MNERNRNKLLQVDDNVYYLPDNGWFYKEVNGDFEFLDVNEDGTKRDSKLHNKLLRKYRKKIKEEYAKKYGD